MGFSDGGKEGQKYFWSGFFEAISFQCFLVAAHMFVRGILSMIINKAKIVIQNYNNPDGDVEGHNSIPVEICTT